MFTSADGVQTPEGIPDFAPACAFVANIERIFDALLGMHCESSSGSVTDGVTTSHNFSKD